MNGDNKKPQRQSGSMTVGEAGRKGGEKTAQKYGADFFRRIGRKGGEARSENRNQSKKEQENDVGKSQPRKTNTQ